MRARRILRAPLVAFGGSMRSTTYSFFMIFSLCGSLRKKITHSLLGEDLTDELSAAAHPDLVEDGLE
jgi:hypothetical protein